MDWLACLNRHHPKVAIAPGVEVEVLNWSYSESLADNAPHRHTYFEACLVGDHGRGVFIVENVEHPIGPGDLFLARPGVVHQIKNTEVPWMELYWVSFQLTPAQGALPRHIREFVESDAFLRHDDGAGVTSVWKALRTVAQRGQSEAVAPLASALLLAYAHALVPSAPPEEPGPGGAVAGEQSTDRAAAGPVRLALRYISDNLDRPLRIEEVARHVNLSPRHLSRLLHRYAGTTFTAYVMQARMDRARNLLRRTDLPVKEVAARVGFRNVHHFTATFALHTGSPPAAFRKGAPGADSNRNPREKKAAEPYV